MATQPDPSPRSAPEDRPSLDLAYGFVLPSYQWALARFEAGNARLQALLTVVISLSLTAPTLIRLLDPSLSFTDGRFALAGGCFVAAMWAGVWELQSGTVALAHPRVLLNDWAGASAAEFKYAAVYYSADHLDRNVASIRRKWLYTMLMLFFFFGELVLLAAWAAGG